MQQGLQRVNQPLVLIQIIELVLSERGCSSRHRRMLLVSSASSFVTNPKTGVATRARPVPSGLKSTGPERLCDTVVGSGPTMLASQAR
jgi:hypothetical protein